MPSESSSVANSVSSSLVSPYASTFSSDTGEKYTDVSSESVSILTSITGKLVFDIVILLLPLKLSP